MRRQSGWQKILSRNVGTEPDRIYCIAFIPHSGSAWLGHMVAKTRALGIPKEWFNHNAATHAIRNSGAGNFREYYQYLKHAHQANSVFGAEVAFQHLDKLIQEGYEHVLDEMDAWFFLRRRDFVAQAVSLYRSVQSDRYHARGDEPASDSHLEYDRDKVAKLVFSIMNQEWRFSQYFEQKGVTPSLLWYEDLLSMKPEDILSHLATILGVDIAARAEVLKPAGEIDFPVTNDDSKDIIERFKQENSELIDFWREFRGTRPIGRFIESHPDYANALAQKIRQ